jgi:hypothetical protein
LSEHSSIGTFDASGEASVVTASSGSFADVFSPCPITLRAACWATGIFLPAVLYMDHIEAIGQEKSFATRWEYQVTFLTRHSVDDNRRIVVEYADGDFRYKYPDCD